MGYLRKIKEHNDRLADDDDDDDSAVAGAPTRIEKPRDRGTSTFLCFIFDVSF